MSLVRASPLLFAGLIACSRTTAADDQADTTSGETNATETNATETSGDESSESSASDSDDATTGESDDLSFLPESDLGPVSCDIVLQDCPDGQKCTIYPTGGVPPFGNKCVEVYGDQKVGEPCHHLFSEGTDDCDANSMCINPVDVDGETLGECAPFCTGPRDPLECPPGYSCSPRFASIYSICRPTCDPLLQDCGQGLACYWTLSDFNCFTDHSDKAAGDPCDYGYDCDVGNYCADASTLPDCAEPTCCTNYCDLAIGDSQCAGMPGTACVAFFELGTAPAGQEDLGICIVP